MVGRLRMIVAAMIALALLAGPAAAAVPGGAVRVIVRGAPGGADEVARAVAGVGGEVVGELDVLDGVVAEVRQGRLAALRVSPGVVAVTEDGTVEFLDDDDDDGDDGFDDDWADDSGIPDLTGSLPVVNSIIGACSVWSDGYTGTGIGVALIDTGVVPVQGLQSNVINGPDLSFDSQTDSLRHLDGYGHGTHMAGIIAGRDGTGTNASCSEPRFLGVAPGANLINVKVGAADGAVDVSQVIAAIDWVVQHRNDPGLNIRVLNLSFGNETLQDPRLDPLSYAAEVAWRKGIVVVASSGNSGTASPRLNNPAINPYVIAVGAGDTQQTTRVDDDIVADFSTVGDASRRVDLVAPGRSIVSLRNPGSHADLGHPGAVVGTRFFRGSGTSQAAAVVSGAAALLLQQRPNLTPDQVKELLVASATPMPRADPAGRGAGMLNVERAMDRKVPRHRQTWAVGSGTGSLELARGGSYVADGGIPLDGERDIFGNPWDSRVWAPLAEAGQSWQGGDYLGTPYTGEGWGGLSFTARTWRARTWRDMNWAARTWRSDGWVARTWRNGTWAGGDWLSDGWLAEDWLDSAWTGLIWR